MTTMPWTCSACYMQFRGLSGFDDHRVGKYCNTPPDYGRRCLSTSEMFAKGYQIDEKLRWYKPMTEEQAAKMREIWGKKGQKEQEGE